MIKFKIIIKDIAYGIISHITKDNDVEKAIERVKRIYARLYGTRPENITILEVKILNK